MPLLRETPTCTYIVFFLATEDPRPVNVEPVATTGGFVSLTLAR